MKNKPIKSIIKTILVLILLVFFNLSCLPCKSLEQKKYYDDILDEQYEKMDIDKIENAVPDDTKKDLEEIGVDLKKPNEIENFNITKIFEYIFLKSKKLLKSPFTLFINCIMIILLFALFNSFKSYNLGSDLNSSLGILTAVCSCGIIIIPIIECVTNISSVIKNFSNFMLCFIPVFTGIIAISKGAISSITYNSTIFLVAQLISAITADLLLPITGSFLALCISGSINENFNISGLTSAIKKTVIFTLSLLVTIFIGIFTIQTTIASNADTLGIKTAKFLSSSFIPIIGNSLGDALSSIFSGLNIIKSTVGGFGIIVAIVTLLPPILTVGFFIIFTAFSKEISKALEIKTMEKTLSAIKDCLSILLAFLICYGILIISTTSLIINMGGK